MASPALQSQGGAAQELDEGLHTPASSRTAAPPQGLRRNPRYRFLTERLHRLGPRPVAEAIIEVAAGRDVIEVLEQFARFEPEFVEYVGACDWPPLPIARVA
jgi:hypothetical protein